MSLSSLMSSLFRFECTDCKWQGNQWEEQEFEEEQYIEKGAWKRSPEQVHVLCPKCKKLISIIIKGTG